MNFDVNTIPVSERVHITKNLLRWGINIDQYTGKIDYIKGTSIPEVKAASIHLIRHAETMAVAKHEFMSDTSNNCGFTEEGEAITRKQAAELDPYDFDIALYGPIPRVKIQKRLLCKSLRSLRRSRFISFTVSIIQVGNISHLRRSIRTPRLLPVR